LELKYFIVGVLFIWLIILKIDKKVFEERGIERGSLTLLWRTEKGLKVMDFCAKKARRFWIFLSSLAVVVTIPLMFFVLYSLALSAKYIILTPGASAGVVPVIPGVRIPGSPIFLPLGYGILALITVLVAHELSHGIIARVEGIKIKSMGAFFLTILPLGAFVEPDEEEMKKSPRIAKLRVFAAGSFGNFLLALTAFLALISMSNSFLEPSSIQIVDVVRASPADGILEKGMILEEINGKKIASIQDFGEVVTEIKPNQAISIKTDKGSFTITPIEGEDDPERGFVGIKVNYAVKEGISKYIGMSMPLILISSFNWIFLLNLFIGFTNLLPLHILDGGRMFEELVAIISPGGAKHVASIMSLIILSLILLNISPLLGISFH
jgi:membrane-associated protease RseP (regulator of RpoE activity)